MAVAFLAGYLNGGLDRGILYLLVSGLPLQLWSFVFLRYWWTWVKRNGVNEERTKALARRTVLICRKKFFEEADTIRTDRDTFRQLWRLSTFGCLGVSVFLVFAVLYSRPVAAVIYTRWIARKTPGMWIVLRPLPEVALEHSGGRKFSYFGYEFDVPWTDLEQENPLESMTLLYFSSGPFVSFPNPERSINETEVLRQTGSARGVDIGTIFGQDAMRSNYALRSKILNLTPRDVNLFTSRQETVGNSVLLILKTMDTNRIKGDLYSFQTDWLRGFQEGNPSIDDMTIVIAYDTDDRRYEFWIGSRKGAQRPSQADVNYILHSFRPVSAAR